MQQHTSEQCWGAGLGLGSCREVRYAFGRCAELQHLSTVGPLKQEAGASCCRTGELGGGIGNAAGVRATCWNAGAGWSGDVCVTCITEMREHVGMQGECKTLRIMVWWSRQGSLRAGASGWRGPAWTEGVGERSYDSGNVQCGANGQCVGTWRESCKASALCLLLWRWRLPFGGGNEMFA